MSDRSRERHRGERVGDRTREIHREGERVSDRSRERHREGEREGGREGE